MSDNSEVKRNKFLSQNSSGEYDNKNDTSVNKMIKRHKILRFYKVLAVIVVVLLVIVGIIVSWNNKQYTDYEIKHEYSWSRAEGTQVITLGETMICYSKDGMNCTNSKGDTIWNQTYEMQNPIVRTCRNVVAVGDYGGRTIYISNTEEILGSIDTTMPIRDFCVAANGVVATILDDSDITAIYLYSVSGEALVYFKTVMSKSGYPSAIAISDSGSQVAVSYLKAENGKISSNIGFYNFSAVGQNYTDNLVGAHGYADSVIPFIRYMNNYSSVAVSDNRMMFYQGKQIPNNTKDIFLTDEIKSIYYSEDYIGLVFVNSLADTKYRLDIYNTSGEKINEIEFDIDYKDIILGQAGAVIYSENECIVYDWKWRLKFENKFNDSVERIISTDSISKYILVTSDKIQIINLK